MNIKKEILMDKLAKLWNSVEISWGVSEIIDSIVFEEDILKIKKKFNQEVEELMDKMIETNDRLNIFELSIKIAYRENIIEMINSIEEKFEEES